MTNHSEHASEECGDTIHLGSAEGKPFMKIGCNFDVCFVFDDGKWIHVDELKEKENVVFQDQLYLKPK